MGGFLARLMPGFPSGRLNSKFASIFYHRLWGENRKNTCTTNDNLRHATAVCGLSLQVKIPVG